MDRVVESEADAAPGPMRLAPSARLVATVALMTASAMQAADATIANVALPRLEHDLGGGVVLGAWVVTSYLCATAVVAPLTGWLRRRFGVRDLFAAAVGVFVIASLACSLSPSPATIIAARILQGAGGGVIHPLAQAILLDIYPRERYGRMLAIWGATVMVGPIVGPALGGAITDLVSWRWVFVVNLPLGALAIWGMRRVLPQTATETAHTIDFLGIALLATAVGSLQLCLERGVGRSWLDSPELLIEAAVMAASVVAMTTRARRSGFTVFRLEVFKDVNFAAAAFYNFVTSGLLFVVIVFIPAVGQGPLGYTATLAGLTIVPRGIATMFVMLLVGQLVGKVDLRILLAGGILLMSAGLAFLSTVPPRDAVPIIVIGSTLQAVGGGMLFTCLSTIGFSTLPEQLRTDAAGVYSLLRQLGCASGVALMTAVLRARVEGYLPGLDGGSGASGGNISTELLDAAKLQAYTACFREMAVATLFLVLGLKLFRVGAVTGPGTGAAES